MGNDEELPFATDYDGAWKDALDYAPGLFLKRFQERITRDINWTRDHQSLDDELRQMSVQDQEGVRRVDRLLRFETLSEDELYLHIEVQCYYDKELGRRVMTYRHRLRGRFGKPVVTIVILGDARRGWRPKRHKEGQYDSSDQCEWIPIKLLDLEANLAELEQEENLFALFVAAHLATIRTRKDMAKRQEEKIRLLSNRQTRKLDREDGKTWYRLLDYLMKLPEERNRQVHETLFLQKTEESMKYVSFAERTGHEKGRTEGREEGKLMGQVRLCQELLKQPQTPEEELEKLPVEELAALLGQLRQQLLSNGH